MSTTFDELRSNAMQVDVQTTAPTGADLYEGRVYFNASTGKLYVYINSSWKYIQLS